MGSRRNCWGISCALWAWATVEMLLRSLLAWPYLRSPRLIHRSRHLIVTCTILSLFRPLIAISLWDIGMKKMQRIGMIDCRIVFTCSPVSGKEVDGWKTWPRRLGWQGLVPVHRQSEVTLFLLIGALPVPRCWSRSPTTSAQKLGSRSLSGPIQFRFFGRRMRSYWRRFSWRRCVFGG